MTDYQNHLLTFDRAQIGAIKKALLLYYNLHNDKTRSKLDNYIITHNFRNTVGAIFFPHNNESNKRKHSKRVHFKEDLNLSKGTNKTPSLNLNSIQVLKATFYSVSLKELNLLKGKF